VTSYLAPTAALCLRGRERRRGAISPRPGERRRRAEAPADRREEQEEGRDRLVGEERAATPALKIEEETGRRS
jgi:hypothetical protein